MQYRMIRRQWEYFLILFITGGLLCSEPLDDVSDFTDVTWQLESVSYVSADSLLHIPDDAIYTIAFKADGSISVRNACWVCTGTYQYNRTGNTISIEAACPDEVCGRGQFIDYGTALMNASRLEHADRVLILHINEDDKDAAVLNHKLVHKNR